jgi:ABC-type microcin C transport system permease subunit YejE
MKTSVMFLSSLLLLSCHENEDIVHSVPATGSIEAIISVRHMTGSTDILTTKRIVHANTLQQLTFVTNDTIPSLGEMVAEGKNEDGDTKSVLVEKNYEIFITVK